MGFENEIWFYPVLAVAIFIGLGLFALTYLGSGGNSPYYSADEKLEYLRWISQLAQLSLIVTIFIMLMAEKY